jgi:hypothetical protein
VSIASRVVPEISLTTRRSSPSSLLTNDDLPTFGRPTTAMRVFLLGQAFRQLVHQLVEQVAGVLAVLRRHRHRIAGAEPIEVVEVRPARIVHLVRDQHPRLVRGADHLGDPLIARVQPLLRVDDEQDHVRLLDRHGDLLPDLAIHGEVRVVGQSARVHQPERAAVPLRLREVAIARGTRLLAHDRFIVADDAVEQRRLAHVGAPDQGDDGHAHAAPRLLSAPAGIVSPS